MSDKLNLMQKIMKARVLLSNQKLRKTGFNAHTNHRYYETADFLPALNKICNNLGIFIKQDFLKDYAVLTVFNSEDPKEEPISFKLEYLGDIASDNVRMTNIQKYGAILTYLERYLYCKAFDITEDDIYDALKTKATALINKLDSVKDSNELEKIWLSLDMQEKQNAAVLDLFKEKKNELERRK